MMQILTEADGHLSNHAMSFAKYHGNGNDFIIVMPEDQQRVLARSKATELCDRHRGIGADGILLLTIKADHLHMQVINADGSEAFNCGNGLRCAARYYFDNNPALERVIIALGANFYECKKHRDQIEVRMGLCTIAKKDELYFSAVDATALVFDAGIGNEHRIFWFKERGNSSDSVSLLVEEAKAKVAGWQHYNLGFVFAEKDQQFASFVYERGVGLTQSCGTSAIAAACAIASYAELESGELIINQPGGIIRVSVARTQLGLEPCYAVVQSGKAEAVFQGIWPIGSFKPQGF